MQIHRPILGRLAAALNAGLATAGQTGVFVGRQIPAERPPRGVVLSNRGGRQRNVVQQRIVVAANAWSTTDDDADLLAAISVAALLQAASDDPDNPISHIECLTTPTDTADESGAAFRFFQFDIWYRSSALD